MLSVQQLLDQKPKGIFSVAPTDPVLTAIKKMAEHHVGALLVMNGDKLVGIISERDYARKIILQNRSSAETPVRDIMSSPVITVRLEDSTDACMRICTDRRVRHLPVVDGGKVVGVLSIGDLVKAVINAQTQEIEQLQRYIAG